MFELGRNYGQQSDEGKAWTAGVGGHSNSRSPIHTLTLELTSACVLIGK